MLLVLAVSAQRNSPTVLDLNKQTISLTKLVAVCTKALLFLLWQQLTELNVSTRISPVLLTAQHLTSLGLLGFGLSRTVSDWLRVRLRWPAET